VTALSIQRRIKRHGRSGLLAVLAVAVPACFSGEPRSSTGPGSTAAVDCRLLTGAGGSAVLHNIAGLDEDRQIRIVAIRSFAFQPAEIRIPAGSTVVWINCEPEGVEPHTATADGGDWSTPLLGPGQAAARTYDQPGTHAYHCAPHPFMRATLIIE
jgi:plastocyanin